MPEEKELTPGERIATAIVDYCRSAEAHYAVRTAMQNSAYRQLVRVIDEALKRT